MKEVDFKPKGICAVRMNVKISDDGTIEDISILGGCDGNHKGLIALCKGMQASEVVQRLKGIRCGAKATSCPDQLAKAIEQAL